MNYQLIRISDNQPMATDPFYTWLSQFDKRSLHEHTISAYLVYTGFVVGRDAISEEDQQFLKYILEHWYYSTPEHREPCAFAEMFSGPGKFYILGKSGKYHASKKLLNIVQNAGWIYDVCPKTTYFELMADGRLYARYQSIFGQRLICNIEGA